MPSIESHKVYQDYTAGLNDRISPIQLKENESSVISNAIVNNRGLLEKINGYVKDHSPFPNSSDSFIRFLLNLKIGSSVDVLLMAAQDNANSNLLYKVDLKKTSGDSTSQYIGHTDGTASFTNGSPTVTGFGTLWLSNLKTGDKIKNTVDGDSFYVEILTVNSNTSLTLVSPYGGTSSVSAAYIARIILSKNNVPRGIVFDNKAIITNGSEPPMTYDNTSLKLITDVNAPKARYIVAHKQRVFMANTGPNPSRIFWSNVNNEQIWNAASEEDIFPQDNGTIVSIVSFGDSLVVFKNSGSSNAVYQIIGNFDQDDIGEVTFIRKVETWENIGIIAERSPVIHNGYLYFIAETGLYRIDQRMYVEKVTFNIDNFIRSLNFTLGPSQSKSFTFDTAAQWNTGNLSNIRVTSDGKLKSIFDRFDITDAMKGDWLTSVVMDANKDVHIAYVSASNGKQIKYIKWLYSDQSTTAETVFTDTTNNIGGLSIDVALNGNVGIAYALPNVAGATQEFHFVERTTSWQTPQLVFTIGGAGLDSQAVDIRYTGLNNPKVLVSRAGGGQGASFWVRSGPSTWTGSDIASGAVNPNDLSLILATTGFPRVALKFLTSTMIRVFTSDDDINWTEGNSFTTGSNGRSYTKIALNSLNQIVTGFSDTTLKQRNHVTNTTTILDPDTAVQGSGFILDSADLAYAYYTDTTTTEKYVFESSTQISNPGALSNTIYAYNRSFANTGHTFASVTFGISANQIIVRRLAFRGVWDKESSDSTLTAWGIYHVVGEIDNSGTITHEIALNTFSPVNSFNVVVPESLISTNPALVFIHNRLTFVLGAFAAPEIDAIVDNYTGAGVDAKQIVGLSFNNEMYHSGTVIGNTANNTSLIMDKFGAFLRPDYPVSAMERFKNKLYAGLSTKGDLLILQQGFTFDGSSYTMDVQFKEDFLDSIELEKDIYKIYVLFEVKSLGNFIFSYRTDSFATFGGSSWTDTTIDQTTKGIFEIPISKKARSLQTRIKNAENNASALISFVIIFGNLHLR